jgi:hypothetical protein
MSRLTTIVAVAAIAIGSASVGTAAPKKKEEKKVEPAPTSTTNAVFPNAIDPKFSKETPAKARLHTCSAQYQANKKTNANGGLKWIVKGGGYWSECNKRLKG